jgi:hypothetical protein
MRIASLSLVAWLGLGGSLCLVTSAIAPQVALAYTSRLNLTLERQPNESYDTLVRRAEAVARAAAQRSFDNDILVTEAEIIVTGQHIGLSAPILTLAVNRDNWKNRPDARRWSTYYPNSKQLLRIDDPVAATPAAQQAQQRPEPTLGTGVIQSTLRWATTDDLDLEITDPSGQRVFFQNKRVPSGGQLDVDSNANCENTITNPVENIFWPPTGAPPGNYVARVNLYKRCGTTTGAIPFRLRLLVQGREQNLTGNVDDSNQTVSFPFSITAGGAAPGQPAPSTGQPATPRNAQPATPRNAQPATPRNAQPATPANPTPAQPSTNRSPINRARDVQRQINNNNAPRR